MSPTIVRIRNLTRRFGEKTALDNVSLDVEAGGVLGLVGENGAGKTTLIKHILGLLRAQEGTVRVFDRDPAVDPVGVLSRIGTLSEDPDLPEWMRIDQLMRYTRAFRPRWDDNYASQLLSRFRLDRSARVGALSKGQKARVGLVIALAYRPEFLVLDEPSSGLDPIVRRDILATALQEVSEDGRTVLFSSHLLDEVERVADHVTMIHAGQVAISAELTEIQASHRALRVRFRQPRSVPPTVDGALHWEGRDQEWTVITDNNDRVVESLSRSLGGNPGDPSLGGHDDSAEVLESRPASLDEVFVSRAGRHLERPDP